MTKLEDQFATKSRVNQLLLTLQENMEDKLVIKKNFLSFQSDIVKKVDLIQETAMDMKRALSNHTQHLTANKSTLAKTATVE